MVASSNIWDVWNAIAVCSGIALIALIVGACVFACLALDHGRSVLPWSVRHRVEKARASKEVAEMRVGEEEAELRYLALQPVRQKIVEAIDTGEYVSFAQLTSGRSDPEGDEMRRQAYR